MTQRYPNAKSALVDQAGAAGTAPGGEIEDGG